MFSSFFFLFQNNYNFSSFFFIIFNFNLLLFFVGLFGVLLIKKHFLLLLMSFELQFLALGNLFVYCSFFRGDGLGYIIVIIIQMIAACEVALGLALLSKFFFVVQKSNLFNKDRKFFWSE